MNPDRIFDGDEIFRWRCKECGKIGEQRGYMPRECLYCGSEKVICVGVKYTDERGENEPDRVC